MKRRIIPNKMIKIGITGGIGAGKTYLSSLLVKRGIPIYNTDNEARRIMCTVPSVRSRLIALIGEDVFLEDGSLNKRFVSQYIMESSDHVTLMNAIVHPFVRSDFLSYATRQTVSMIGMECAILFESGFNTLVDYVIAVTAPEDLRIQRVCRRDNIDRGTVCHRLSLQMSEQQRLERAHFVVCNDGTQDVELMLNAILDKINAIG